MKTPVLLLLPALVGIGCQPGPTPPKTVAQVTQPAQDFAHTPDRPGYTVSITYSPRSLAQLKARRETVVVASYFSAQPKPDTPKALISDIGDINLGTLNTEVVPGAPAHIDPITLAQTNGHDPELLINVFSGRKSSPDNLLSCSIYQGPLTPILNTTVPISCKLIAE